MRLKVKLLTIGILALLLCATVPMTATAARAPPDKTDVYLYKLNTHTGMLSLGKVVGYVTPVGTNTYQIDIDLGHYTPFRVKLQGETGYRWDSGMLLISPLGGAWASTDGNGVGTITFTLQTTPQIDAYAGGSVFIIEVPVT